LPEFSPFARDSDAAGHVPSSATFAPPGSLPHFLNSQQFCAGIIKLLISQVDNHLIGRTCFQVSLYHHGSIQSTAYNKDGYNNYQCRRMSESEYKRICGEDLQPFDFTHIRIYTSMGLVFRICLFYPEKGRC
jgi:hypothetical protein